MDAPKTKKQLLEILRMERSRWEELLANVGMGRMTQPGVLGEWSVKDMIAHVTWYEREMVGLLKMRVLAGSDLWELPHDQRNASIFEANRDRLLPEVLTEARQIFEELVLAIESLTDDDLVDPARFAGMPSEWQPWKLIAENSYEHYRQHMPHVRAWLDKSDT